MFDSNKTIKDYIEQNDWRVKENSNMGFSLQGLNNHIAAKATTDFWLDEVYPDYIKEIHKEGDVHIHDLQSLSSYCGGWDLHGLLTRGFTGVVGKVETKPAKHFRTALGQLVNFIYTLQGEIAGAQAVSSFDTLLAPFVRKDGLTYKEVKQGIQEFVFNINVPTRVGFQSPFSNITLDLVPSGSLANDNVVIGGEIQPETYKDFQEEIDMINIAFAEVMMEGDAAGRVFTFPIPTYNITKEFDWDSPVAKKIFEMTAKYGIPYFSNFINSDMSPDDARSMCPLDGKEEILIKSSRGFGLEKLQINQAYYNQEKHGKEYEVLSGDKFVRCSVEKYDGQNIIEVELENGHSVRMTETHANMATRGFMSRDILTVPGSELDCTYYLPYSLSPLEGSGGTYDLGYFVGCYAGDGSLDGDTAVVMSLSRGRKEKVLEALIDISNKYFCGRHEVRYDGNGISLRIKSRAANGLCRDFVSGKKRDKNYKPNVFGTSLEFRRGVADGHYETDGGNSYRIYTSSYEMVKSLNLLFATLGTTTRINVDDRDTYSGSLSDEPIFCVRFYKLKNDAYNGVWYKHNGYLWMRINRVRRKEGSVGYCLSVKDDEPLFTLANTGIVTHNCRLRLDNRELRKRGGGLFGANPLTGSVGVVTINLPRIGYLAKTEEEFFERLGMLMDLAKESLEIKRAKIEQFSEEGLYPYATFYLNDVYSKFGKYWQNHFSTIGLIGMNEALLNFEPLKKDIATKEGNEFAEKVLTFMRDRIGEYQLETNNLFNLEATPAEGTTRRLAGIDTKKFPGIVTANKDKKGVPYYTNSTQLPVGLTGDVFEALDLQDGLQTKYTGGTVFHIYLGEAAPSSESIKKLVKTISYNYKLPYFTITPTFSICPRHGYLSGEHHYCPKCDEELGLG